MLFQTTEDGYITNLYNYQLINKSDKELAITFSVEGKPYILFEPVGQAPKTTKNKISEGAIFIKIPQDKLTERSTKLTIDVLGDGQMIDETSTTFLGPTE